MPSALTLYLIRFEGSIFLLNLYVKASPTLAGNPYVISTSKDFVDLYTKIYWAPKPFSLCRIKSTWLTALFYEQNKFAPFCHKLSLSNYQPKEVLLEQRKEAIIRYSRDSVMYKLESYLKKKKKLCDIKNATFHNLLRWQIIIRSTSLLRRFTIDIGLSNLLCIDQS